MNTLGYNIKITFFGESHGPYIGVVIDNIPSGLKINQELIKHNLEKRKPKANISTSRIETDNFQFISGVFNNLTTGAALTIIIQNTNIISKDYETIKNTPRPSHADYPAYIKYKSFNDYRGGGVFSGRITALWMIVGAISEQILSIHNIVIGSHIYSLKDIKDKQFNLNQNNEVELKQLNQDSFPVIDETTKNKMLKLISLTKDNSDSIGGVVESKIINVPTGLGFPYFLSVESYISQALFSIPGIKGIEFGIGFDITKHYGSEMNDQYTYENKKIITCTNNNGGILGGLTTGSPIIVRTAFKPTASIKKPQKTINLKTKENTNILIKGRHDPQIVSRATHVVNSVLNFVMLDLLLFNLKKDVI